MIRGLPLLDSPRMADALTEQRFEVLADETLRKILDALADEEDDAMDVDLESGVLTISFEDDTAFVINAHRAARQIWMAAGATAWHFNPEGGRWVSGKTGEELWDMVESRVSKVLGRPLKLRD